MDTMASTTVGRGHAMEVDDGEGHMNEGVPIKNPPAQRTQLYEVHSSAVR